MSPNPRLRLGPISSGCRPVSRESMVTALENGVSSMVDWAPNRRAAAHSAGAGPPSSGKAVFSNSTIGMTWMPATKPTATMTASAGATRTVGRAESNAPSGARAPRAFKEYDSRDRHSDGRRKRQRGKVQVNQGDGSDQHDGVEENSGSPRSRRA